MKSLSAYLDKALRDDTKRPHGFTASCHCDLREFPFAAGRLDYPTYLQRRLFSSYSNTIYVLPHSSGFLHYSKFQVPLLKGVRSEDEPCIIKKYIFCPPFPFAIRTRHFVRDFLWMPLLLNLVFSWHISSFKKGNLLLQRYLRTSNVSVQPPCI